MNDTAADLIFVTVTEDAKADPDLPEVARQAEPASFLRRCAKPGRCCRSLSPHR